MTWAVWLLAPVAVTAVVCVLSWLRSRPVRQPDTAAAIRAHGEYLDALVQTARSRDGGVGASSRDSGVAASSRDSGVGASSRDDRTAA